MTLQIIDRGKNKLYPDGNFWELSRKEENNCFYGVSFVSSIKFIEENVDKTRIKKTYKDFTS